MFYSSYIYYLWLFNDLYQIEDKLEYEFQAAQRLITPNTHDIITALESPMHL